MNLLIFGPQGAGKGTQAKKIAEAYEIPHVATGDMFRAAIAEGTELGRRVEPLLASGQLVSDETTIAIIRDRLAHDDAQAGFVLDGFPRNIVQAEALDAMLEEIDRPLSGVLLLELADETARERLSTRAVLEGRADDQPDVIDRRLRDYHEQTEPVVAHYLATGKLVTMHAERTIDEVWAEIVDALEQVQARA
ncbi:MAG: adenylate kinase [Gaiellaceae bacterium]